MRGLLLKSMTAKKIIDFGIHCAPTASVNFLHLLCHENHGCKVVEFQTTIDYWGDGQILE